MSEENLLVCMPKKDIEAIYQFVLSKPAKEVLQVLEHFKNIRIAEEQDQKTDIKIEADKATSQDNS